MNGNMIRVGSRESLLAVRQSELIMEQDLPGESRRQDRAC